MMRIKNCRICKGDNLVKFLDLGLHPPSDAFLRKDQLSQQENKYPVDAYLCLNCSLVQLGYIVPAQEMFNKEYVYVTSISKTADRHFGNYANDIMERLLKPGDFVVEMGSNDGTLLKHFKNAGARVLGVDPSRAAMMAVKNQIETVNDFFSESVAKEIVRSRGQADAIVGANVFAHIHDLDDVMRGVDILLKKDGVFVMEFPYLLNLVKNLEFDTIYHEHLSYFSVKPLVHLFGRFGMHIFDIISTPIHGGSIRIFVRRGSQAEPAGRVREFLDAEKQNRLYSAETFHEFSAKVSNFKSELIELLNNLKKQGKKIAGNGAPAKGNTLLNYCQLGPDIIEFIAEINPLKHFTYTPGMHIPVLPISAIKEKKPDYLIILPWNLKDDIIAQEHEFSASGGRFIIPLPKPIII